MLKLDVLVVKIYKVGVFKQREMRRCLYELKLVQTEEITETQKNFLRINDFWKKIMTRKYFKEVQGELRVGVIR